jgi:hypothetical protein
MEFRLPEWRAHWESGIPMLGCRCHRRISLDPRRSNTLGWIPLLLFVSYRWESVLSRSLCDRTRWHRRLGLLLGEGRHGMKSELR